MLNLIGIPTYAGALYSGTEAAPAHLRGAGIFGALSERGIAVNDLGDLPLPDVLPRHNVPPIRNWPGPRLVWDAILREAGGWFSDGGLTLILGGDCSLVTGTATHLRREYGESFHLLVIDAHVDVVAPSPERCLGAAASGLWFLTRESSFWPGPWIRPEQITVVACQEPPADTGGIRTVTLSQLRAAAQSVLSGLPESARVLVHFDVDAIGLEEMPAAYSPSQTGLSLDEARALLGDLLADPRVVGLEVTEFLALRDATGAAARALVALLGDAIKVGLAARNHS